MRKKRRANSWDRKVRSATRHLTDVQRGKIALKVMEKFPKSSTEHPAPNRARMAAVMIFIAERDPPPDTTEITKAMFPGHSKRRSRRGVASQFLHRLKSAELVEETYEQKFVGQYARTEGGKSQRTPLHGGVMIKEHTAHWEIAEGILE